MRPFQPKTPNPMNPPPRQGFLSLERFWNLVATPKRKKPIIEWSWYHCLTSVVRNSTSTKQRVRMRKPRSLTNVQQLQRLQGYFAHKKTPTPLGHPYDPCHRPAVGSQGGALFVSEVPLSADRHTREQVFAFAHRPWSPPRGKILGYQATCKREFKLPWREAGPPNHLDNAVDSDQ